MMQICFCATHKSDHLKAEPRHKNDKAILHHTYSGPENSVHCSFRKQIEIDKTSD